MASVKGRLPRQQPAESKQPDERRVRALLPSWRVAEFRVPKVRDAMAIREQALEEGGVDPATIEDSRERGRAFARVSNAMERIALRRLLVGVTDRPVELVYKDGFNPETSTAGMGEAEALAAMQAAVDAQAVARAARIRPLSDLEWDEALDDDPDAGPISKLANAYEGTDEARDWQTLHTFAGRLLAGLKAIEGDAPKASRRPTPPSVGFVT